LRLSLWRLLLFFRAKSWPNDRTAIEYGNAHLLGCHCLRGVVCSLLQFPLTIATSHANGMTALGAVIAYFSFFTILTNLIVAVGLTCSLLLADSRWGGFFSSPVVVSATALYTAIVGALYSFLLQRLWNPSNVEIVDYH